MRFIVYKHVNKFNGKVYVGITSKNPPTKRWGKNGNLYHENTYFYNAIKKYGWDNFTHEILRSNLTEIEALELEKELIAYYKSMNKSYNMSDGYDYIGVERRLKIVAYDIRGKYLGTYISIHQTSVVYNICETAISECANLRRGIKSVKGFIFLHEGDSIDKRLSLIAKDKEEKLRKRNEKLNKIGPGKGVKVPVVMLDKNTNTLVKEFSSIRNAAKYLNKPYLCNKIVDCCKTHNNTITRKRILTVQGYKWMYKNDYYEME